MLPMLIVFIISISAVSAADNVTHDVFSVGETTNKINTYGDDISKTGSTIDDFSESTSNNEIMGSMKVGDYTYNNELEIQTKDVTLIRVHEEKYVLNKNWDVTGCSYNDEFPDQKISIRIKNIDYDVNDEWSTEYPAILKITFKIYKNGNYLSSFSKYTDEYGYVTFSSSTLPDKTGKYTIIASFDGKEPYFSFGNENSKTTYYEYLPVEKSFTITKKNPTEHKYTITSYWYGQKYTITTKLTDKQYQSLKTAKKNKKTKEISGSRTKKYVTAKRTITKKLIVYKVTQNKNTGKIKQKWTKNWKSNAIKLVKLGYKGKMHKKLSKYKGTIWITFKKTIKKKYEIKTLFSTISKDGQYKKGDYISLGSVEPMGAVSISI